ncbi:MAG TPA: hypothetical protein VFT91_11865 [Dehalococcoidia bacterium]|nr:hypothetical protein [Dehalococcoidia bacterium]
MKEFTRARAAAAEREAPTLNGLVSRLDRLHAMAALFAIGLTAFLAIEPTQNWLLLLLSGLAALGTDGIVRGHPRARFTRLDDTALFLFVPALFTLSLGLFLEEVASGYWTLAAGLLSAAPFWAIVHAEYTSVDRRSRSYPGARLVLNVATYVIAFLFFATIYDFDLGLLTGSFAAGTVSLLLAIEVLREEAMDTTRTLLYAVAIGVLLAEAAWAVYFLPLEGGMAALFLLLAFYLMTGLMHNYLADRLNLRTAAEFSAVAVVGLLIVSLSQTL